MIDYYCPGLTQDGFVINFDTNDAGISVVSRYIVYYYYYTNLYDERDWLKAYVTVSLDPDACLFTAYVTDNALTGQIISYERSSGTITRNFDTIAGTTGSSCSSYTTWTYYLSA
jgi:hypothetical protein